MYRVTTPIYVDFGIITVAARPAVEPEVEPRPEPPIDELPYTGFNWMYHFIGTEGALILAGGMMLALKKLKKLRRYYPKHQL